MLPNSCLLISFFVFKKVKRAKISERMYHWEENIWSWTLCLILSDCWQIRVKEKNGNLLKRDFVFLGKYFLAASSYVTSFESLSCSRISCIVVRSCSYQNLLIWMQWYHMLPWICLIASFQGMKSRYITISKLVIFSYTDVRLE